MKKALSFFAAFVLFGVFAPQVRAYDFSATTTSGQTLYYSILSDGVSVAVVFPNSNATSGSQAWNGHTKPTGNLVIPSTVTNGGATYTVTQIGNYTFYDCDDITHVTMPNTVTIIGYAAFTTCSGLLSVALGNGLLTIGNYAFSYCVGLTTIIIPQSLTLLGKGAFKSCSGLTSVEFNAANCSIPDDVDGNTDPFTYCSNITSFTIGNNVTVIPDHLCEETAITSIIIPNSVTSIGYDAFFYCENLTSVTIGNSVTTIGGYAFSSCRNLTSVTIPNSVTTIDNGAFNSSGLISVTIPNSVTTVGEYAFGYCDNLTSVTIGNSVTTIGKGAFNSCDNLSSVTIGNSVTTIGSKAFMGSGLISVTIPNAVTTIGERAFCDCKNLTSVTLSNNIDTIHKFLFAQDSNLVSLTIPNSVTVIEDGAFGNCTGLTSITIPSNVTSVGGAAFYNCTGLTEIHSLNRVAPQLGTYTENGQTYGVFDGVSSSIPVYIPCGSSNSYYSRWSYFSNFIEEEGFTFTATSADEQQGTVQILTMPTCTSPQAVVYASANSGYHFDHWSDNSTANPYSLTVTEDLNLVAYFAADGGGTDGIDDIDAANIRIYSEAGRIVVEGTTDEVNVYDMTGRSVRNDNLPAGVYMVKVGNLPARKVVVMR